MKSHHVKVSKLYLDPATNCRYKDDKVPDRSRAYEWKWYALCTCGWQALSWSWWRRYDAECESGMTVAEWLVEQGATEDYLNTGALVMAFDHIKHKEQA